ncbi:protein translocase subunit SecD [Aestuariivirga litoralis]|uniref:protein translocase subunit SecD n=1 Tax=Aestuariivirga litoralis TaxID=2650924 RepID=UPI0018C62290|nr:protein translocase subunit SecD [Aestuariivirga litoralis]MBG1231473.1 protein translocase subunit SecD [Aestuariivirga litoralis]
MFHYSRWRVLLILGTVLLGIVLALPNALDPLGYSNVMTRFGLKPMTLGLDLQGGSNILMEVDQKDLTDKLQQQLMGDIRLSLREQKVGYSGLGKTDNGVTVTVNKPEDTDKASTELKKLLNPVDSGVLSVGTAVNLFTLTQNGNQFVFAIDPIGFDAKTAGSIKQAIHVIELRINGLGTTESTIQQQGKGRISIQIPGLQDPDRVKTLLGSTAKLNFQLLCAEQATAPNSLPPPDCAAYPQKESVDAKLLEKQKTDATAQTLTDAELKALPQMWVQTSRQATVDGADLTDAQSTFDQNNSPVVSFKFNQKGAVRFGKLTADNVGKPFAIVLDGIVQSAPNINEAILTGSGQISGRFTVEQTNDLAITLRSGALPAKLAIVEERTVGPTLGADSIKAGVYASIAGLVFVMLFMLLPYGFWGIVADLALIVNLILLVGVMSFFGFTLTLPGIAGIVLTLGMAVDSNVLIYERIREEWRHGKSAMQSIETGFKAALSTVTDANVTTLIAAFVLFGVGSGPVRGFAITLAVGIVTTMFTAFVLTRLMVAAWVKRYKPKEINL